ncbi:MAG: protein-disulfide reductase DsbD [Gammaproteobacteria bacterium]|nr:protein-disulfide reductase DsbD [Gammaproteobacteria bacterium]
MWWIKFKLVLLFCGLPLAPLLAFTETDLLPAEEAFIIEAGETSATTLQLRWRIAEGYYLYRHAFKFATSTPGIALGEVEIPAGERKLDDFFGEVETYRQQLTMSLPYQRAAASPATLTLTVVSQGCADIGVCYPPLEQTLTLSLPAALPVARAAGSNASPLDALRSLFADSAADAAVLDADAAFALAVIAVDSETLLLRVEIAPNHYLYKEKFTFAFTSSEAAVSIGAAVMPEGVAKEDDFFGLTTVYHDLLEIPLKVQRPLATAALNGRLTIGYQGCAERGICYPPLEKELAVTLPPAAATAGRAVVPAASAAPPQSPQDGLAASLATGNSFATIMLFFGLGLLLAFTPCVFPMIPILSSIIIGQGHSITSLRAFTLSLVYVLAMAVTYTFAGVIAGLFGANLQAVFQNPWILGSFSLLFVLLALSMFGFFELQLPAALQTRLSRMSRNQGHGTLLGVAVMGLLSALIVGPCVAPPLMGALIYIGQTGDALLGGAALFAMSMGMGVPLLLVGVSAGQLLPRAGGWMNTVKAVFGVTMLAVAIWMLERIVPPLLTMLLWATLLICVAVYMGAVDRIEAQHSGWRRLWKGVGLLLLLQGLLILVGVAMGNRDPLQPLQGAWREAGSAELRTTASHLTLQRVKTVADVEAAVSAAAATGQRVMLDFYADWCISCKELERDTFSNREVIGALDDWRVLQADVTANDSDDKALLRHFSLIGPPALLFFNRRGEEQRGLRVVGFIAPNEFLQQLRNVN